MHKLQNIVLKLSNTRRCANKKNLTLIEFENSNTYMNKTNMFIKRKIQCTNYASKALV